MACSRFSTAASPDGVDALVRDFRVCIAESVHAAKTDRLGWPSLCAAGRLSPKALACSASCCASAPKAPKDRTKPLKDRQDDLEQVAPIDL